MTGTAVVRRLLSRLPLIAPSMLKCDFGNLHREVEMLECAGAQLLHLDVMDGQFVPNLSYGPMVIRSLRELTGLLFDAHLMIAQPERYLPDYLDAGCDFVTFHRETVEDPIPLLRRIKDAGRGAGLAINPKTPVESIYPALSWCDLVLVMSVEPGFGGQKFLPSALEKLKALRSRVGPETVISVDGGISETTIGDCAAAGASLFVAGSALFDAEDYHSAMERLLAAAGISTANAPPGASRPMVQSQNGEIQDNVARNNGVE
jgi:ribulose-phosphate 3-epimerase